MNIKQPTRLLWIIVICTVSALVYLIRLNGGTDLESYGQPTHIGSLLDLMTQGQVFVQHDLNGSMISLPPLHTWLMAPFAAALGLKRLALTLPSFLSVLALSLLVFASGRRRFGELAGGLGAMAVLLSPATAKHIALVGAEPMFALTATVAALAACSARSSAGDAYDERQRWLLFWLVSALSTLGMGLLGILLAGGALLSAYLMTARDPDLTNVFRPHHVGLALFFGVVLAWLIPAGLSHDFSPTTRTLLLEANSWQTSALLKPVGSLLIHYLPFSLFLILALWRVLRHPAADVGQRGFERFLAGWLIVGLLAVSLTKDKGTDSLFALWPACALLVGREMAYVAERMGKTRFAGMAVVIGCVLIGATYNAVHSTNTENYRASALGKELRLAANAGLAANAMKASGIDASRLHHFGTPQTLQLYLGTFRPLIDQKRLDAILVSANGPIDLATGSTGIEALGVQERYPATKQIFRWPDDPSQPPVVQVYRIAR
ncbi:MAG: glycosyltransferase family 39 protein [Propionivibrio sp.]|nr:glycosyltransferase family 39 protein [Propionivibrio sp.]MBP7525240.1 glycosyltransferase family 39 protein [Propionivibrio sp.]